MVDECFKNRTIKLEALANYQIYDESGIIIWNSDHPFDTKIEYNRLVSSGRKVEIASGDVTVDPSEL